MHMYAVVHRRNQINYDEVLHLLARLIAGGPHLLETVYVVLWFMKVLVWETWCFYLIARCLRYTMVNRSVFIAMFASVQ